MLETKIVVDCFRAIREVLKDARDGKARAHSRLRDRAEAILAVRQAALATKAYLYDTRILNEPSDRTREANLAVLWQKAGSAIREHDNDLFHISNVKALGWSDPREWQNVKVSAAKLKVDLLLEQCDWLLEHPPEPGQAST